jgi:hypothetical protein
MALMGSARPLATCPDCRHEDLAVTGVLSRFAAALGHGRTCAYAVGDEISPLRNEACGCRHPLHAVGMPADAGWLPTM